jgi:hypothetical protein
MGEGAGVARRGDEEREKDNDVVAVAKNRMKNAHRESRSRKMQRLMRKLLEALQYLFLPHFEYAAPDTQAAGDSLSPSLAHQASPHHHLIIFFSLR